MRARTFRLLATLGLLGTIALGASWLAHAYVPNQCRDTPSASITVAREALALDSPAQDRAALICLVEAVAALDVRLQGLSGGSIAFDGRIHAPKGFVIVKAPAMEDD